MLSILCPTRMRGPSFRRFLDTLSQCKYANRIQIVIVVDNEEPLSSNMGGSELIAGNYAGLFGQMKLFVSTNRLYAIKAFNTAYEMSDQPLIIWLADDVYFEDKDWITKAIAIYAEKFEDKPGILSLTHGEGAGFGLAPRSYFETYNGGEFYHHGYVLQWADVELTHRAIVMGRYAWVDEDIVTHDKAVDGIFRNIDPSESYELKAKDKMLYGVRRGHMFFMDRKKMVVQHDYLEWKESVV